MIAPSSLPFLSDDQLPHLQHDINTEYEIQKPVLKVLGMGGGGCNAISRMVELGLHGVEFIAANTDHQALQDNPAPVKIQLGPKVTRGLGAGGNPAIGKAAAEESRKEIAEALAGADMVFLTAGMGGGTGTGSIPVAARIAQEVGAVAIAVVTTPFSFEMGRRQKNSAEGLALLREHTNTLIAIPNDRLLYVAPKDLPIETAFRLADDVLRQAVQGIAELITEPGLINVDFSHIRRLMMMGGGSFMAIGHGYGENKSQQAIEQALNHPLLETVSLDHASGIIANFTGGPDLTLFEVEAALTYLQNQTGSQSEIVMGVINDDQMVDRVQVILVVTGIVAPTLESAIPKPVIRESEPAITEDIVETRHPVDTLPVGSYNVSRLQEYPEPTNLDIPAFLRKRVKYAG
ncbi:MAG: cell division protein FtsZ [Anaerolineales bacterium]|nr:cell division protein FtsZ [Anaerolineales bacterium]